MPFLVQKAIVEGGREGVGARAGISVLLADFPFIAGVLERPEGDGPAGLSEDGEFGALAHHGKGGFGGLRGRDSRILRELHRKNKIYRIRNGCLQVCACH